MSFAHGNDLCLTFWADAYDLGVVTFPQDASVLEIGCAEGDWIAPMLRDRPDLRITGIDMRKTKRKAAHLIHGDVLKADFAPASFDAIVAISTLEHIGLGAYQDPLDPDGDRATFLLCAQWLKPGGWVYADVPYRPKGPYTVQRSHRTYDPEAYGARFAHPDLTQVWSKLYEPHHQDGPFLASVWQKA